MNSYFKFKSKLKGQNSIKPSKKEWYEKKVVKSYRSLKCWTKNYYAANMNNKISGDYVMLKKLATI